MKAKTLALLISALCGSAAMAQDNCSNRGDLDPQYCDANKDLVADTPTDPAKLKNPGTLVFSFTPVEDPSVYERLFRPFTEYLGQCTGKRVVFFQVQSNSAMIEAMRSGRLHIGAFSTGPTMFAVNIAGAIPFAIRGTAKGAEGYNLVALVRKDSPIQKMSDLKGKKVAHASPSSNSGNLAPRALWPAQGVTPEKDYQVVYSGKHDQSILGVKSGDYEAAAVASDVLERMIDRGVVKADDFRIIYTSAKFPTDAYVHVHDLEPALAAKLKQCFYDFKVPADMVKGLDGDRFLPADYKKDWELVRQVADSAGQKFGAAAYAAQKAKDDAAAAAKAATPKP
jgi:phosphonate transport system substrate-binding protein